MEHPVGTFKGLHLTAPQPYLQTRRQGCSTTIVELVPCLKKGFYVLVLSLPVAARDDLRAENQRQITLKNQLYNFCHHWTAKVNRTTIREGPSIVIGVTKVAQMISQRYLPLAAHCTQYCPFSGCIPCLTTVALHTYVVCLFEIAHRTGSRDCNFIKMLVHYDHSR